MTKKLSRRVMAILLAVCMIAAYSVSFEGSYAYAASKKVKVKSVTLNHKVYTIKKGKTVKLKTTILPKEAKKTTIVWKSGNKKFATVSKKGVVKASKKIKKTAKVKITATAKGTKKKATCLVYIGTPVKKAVFKKAVINLETGKTANANASVTPAKATVKNLYYSSSNTSVATVDKKGNIKAVNAGTAVITATPKDEAGKAAKLTVKVTKPAQAEGGGLYSDVSDAYNILNAFRADPDNQWYWNESNTEMTKTGELESLIRDEALEEVAKVRAKEAWEQYYTNGVATHNRLDGSSCFTAFPTGLFAAAENLAWGQRSSNEVIADPTRGWAETNYKYDGQGHRRNMLSSELTHVGIACYTKDGKTAWAMCLCAY